MSLDRQTEELARAIASGMREGILDGLRDMTDRIVDAITASNAETRASLDRLTEALERFERGVTGV